jgi:capsular exopolysaccharide synthesis family protein
VNPDKAIMSAISSPAASKPARVESVVEIAWRRKGLVITVLFLVIMGASIALILIPKRMTAQAKVLINRTGATSVDLNTQAELIRSATVLSPALDAPRLADYSIFNGVDNKVGFLKEHLEVKPLADSTVLAVRMSSSKPEEAREVVDAIVSAYVSHIADQRQSVSFDTFKKLSAERKALDDQRVNARKQIVTLQAETSAYLPPEGGNVNMAMVKVRQLSEVATAAQVEASQLKTDLDETLKSLGWTPEQFDEAKLENATAVSPQSVTMLKNNLAALSQQLIEAKRQFVPTHPAVRTIQAQIKDLQLSLASTLKAMYATASTKEREARKLLVAEQETANKVDAKAAELEAYKQLVASNDQQISVIDTKLNQLTLVETIGFTAEKIDEPEIIKDSEVPNTWKTLGLASVIGLVVALMSALVREWVSPSLGAVHRIADTVGVPVLGTLPRMVGRSDKDTAIVTHSLADSAAAEAFRSIRTSMLFGAGRCGTITITSPSGRVGKTTLATNLAISLAQSGKRVVLVDANFRDPMLQNIFAMDNAIGLSGVLSGDDLESSLRRTPIEHLDILTSGPKSPDVSEQLNSTQFADLLRDLNLRYDHVIFDTSSVTGSNDARVIAASCDQTILVVRGERSNRFAATTARDALLSVGASLMGIVVNDAQSVAQAYPPAGGSREAAPAQDRATELASRLRR